MTHVASDDELRSILVSSCRIAVVGMSNNPARPSYGVAQYLLRQGYEIFPVNPTLLGQTVLGRNAYAMLADCPRPIDIADVFRRSEYLLDIVEQASEARIPAVWAQLGVRDPRAAALAQQAGVTLIQDRCIAIEHHRLVARGARR